MLYKKLVFVSYIASIFSPVRFANAQTESHTVGSSDVTCAAGLETCTITCDEKDRKYAPDINCNDAKNCIFNCANEFCTLNARINAQNAQTLTIASSGFQCMKWSQIDSGAAESIEITVSAEAALKNAYINARNAQFLHIDVQSGGTEFGQSGKGSETYNDMYLDCPRDGSPSGSFDAPCVLEVSGGSISAGGVHVITGGGVPHDFQFIGTQTDKVYVACDGYTPATNFDAYDHDDSSVFYRLDLISNGDTCYNDAPPRTAEPTAPTKSPTKAPTSTPTTKTPTTTPTKTPTQTPTKTPTSTPTLAPTLLPTSVPSLQPSVSPSNDPTTSPTKQPSAAPSKNPSPAPTINPTNLPSNLPTNLPTILPTLSQSSASPAETSATDDEGNQGPDNTGDSQGVPVSEASFFGWDRTIEIAMMCGLVVLCMFCCLLAIFVWQYRRNEHGKVKVTIRAISDDDIALPTPTKLGDGAGKASTQSLAQAVTTDADVAHDVAENKDIPASAQVTVSLEMSGSSRPAVRGDSTVTTSRSVAAGSANEKPSSHLLPSAAASDQAQLGQVINLEMVTISTAFSLDFDDIPETGDIPETLQSEASGQANVFAAPGPGRRHRFRSEMSDTDSLFDQMPDEVTPGSNQQQQRQQKKNDDHHDADAVMPSGNTLQISMAKAAHANRQLSQNGQAQQPKDDEWDDDDDDEERDDGDDDDESRSVVNIVM